MISKHIIVFCEGEHDIAFLSRILFVLGFSAYEKKVKDFHKPFNQLYITNLSNKKFEDTEFKFQRPKRKVPYTVLIKDDILVVFHNFDGDGNFASGGAESIKKMYLDLNIESRRKIENYEFISYRFLFFLDSDDIGVEKRLDELKKLMTLEEFENNTIYTKDTYEVGAYIFHDDKDPHKYGKLEDILLEVMKDSNENIFEKSKNYIEENILTTDRQRRFICNSEKEEPIGRIEFKKLKSIISSAGQLQFSGSSNTVIIANSDYIKKADIDANVHCQNIIKLFQ